MNKDSTPDHFEILRKIEKKPQATQRQLAEELGFSLGKLNYCLKAIVFLSKAISYERGKN